MRSQPEAAGQALAVTNYDIKKEKRKKEKKSIPKKVPLFQEM